MDGERLLFSTASEAAIELRNVQCGPRWHMQSERVDRRRLNALAGMRDPQPVAARGFLQDDSCANFDVGDSCHSWVWRAILLLFGGGLARNDVRRFPAQAGGPREGSGPLGTPDSGDDVWIRHGPSPRAAGPIKIGAVPLARTVCVSCSSTLPPRLRPCRHRHDSPPAPRLPSPSLPTPKLARKSSCKKPRAVPGRPVEGPTCPLGHSSSVNQRARSTRASVARTVNSSARSQLCWP